MKDSSAAGGDGAWRAVLSPDERPEPEIVVGDCREVLDTLEADRFDCLVTSPPYLGQRRYGMEGEIGSEDSVAAYVAGLVEVFAKARRVLKPSGTAWINVGDVYTWSGRKPALHGKDGLKPKDLALVPHRLGIALQEDGWWVRAEVLWGKSSPFPESAKDRPSQAHEWIWMLTKEPYYHYDGSGVRQPGDGRNRAARAAPARPREQAPEVERYRSRKAGHRVADTDGRSRSLRTYEPAAPEVWRIAGSRSRAEHFAMCPPELVERCIEAGCPEGGEVLDPMAGAGTTGLVAERMGRRSLLIEMSPRCAEVARARLARARGGEDWAVRMEREALGQARLL